MIENFEKLLTEAKTIAIAGHVRPDGDAVGSCMAVYNYLIKYYPTCQVSVFLETIPRTFLFMNGTDKIIDPKTSDENLSFDLFIVLDCGDAGRLGDAYKYFESAKKTICIDHHLSNKAFAQYNYVVPDASSTCELVYNQLIEARIDKTIAECLYTGIIHDTGVFQYTCCVESTMKIAGKLMSMGIDYSGICDRTFYAKTAVQNKAMGYVLLNAVSYLDGQVVAGVLTLEKMNEFGACPRHLDGIVQQLRCTTGVEVAVFLYETEPGEFKGSTRATRDVDLVEICSKFGGGGHKKAAGFSVTTSDPWSVVEKVVDEVKIQLDELKKNA